jgi:adenine deaminase
MTAASWRDQRSNRLTELNSAAAKLGCTLDAPFMTLSFMRLSPIPELKLADQGLVDAVNLKLTNVTVT